MIWWCMDDMDAHDMIWWCFYDYVVDDKCMVYEMFRITNLYYAMMGINACGMINVFYMVLYALYIMSMVCGCKMDVMVMIYD